MTVINRLLSLLLGLLLLALGLAAIVWVIATEVGAQRLPGQLPNVHQQVLSAVAFGASQSLSSGLGLVVCIVLVVVGILLLFLELKPWAPRRLEMGERGFLRWRIDRRSFEQALNWLLRSRTAARRISIRLHRRWRLTVAAEGDSQTRQEVEAELQSLLQRLGSDGLARVRFKFKRARGVA